MLSYKSTQKECKQTDELSVKKKSRREVKTEKERLHGYHLTKPECQTKLDSLKVKSETRFLNEHPRSQLPRETGSSSKRTYSNIDSCFAEAIITCEKTSHPRYDYCLDDPAEKTIESCPKHNRKSNGFNGYNGNCIGFNGNYNVSTGM